MTGGSTTKGHFRLNHDYTTGAASLNNEENTYTNPYIFTVCDLQCKGTTENQSLFDWQLSLLSGHP